MGSLVRRSKAGFRFSDTLAGFTRSDLAKEHPSYDTLSSSDKRACERFGKRYMEFIDNARIASEVVSEVKSKVGDRLEFYPNLEGTAFCLFKGGKRKITEGLTIIYAHTDSPCLRTKPNADFVQWDPDQKIVSTGVEFNVFGEGGINPHQWTGRSLELRGYTVENRAIRTLPRISVYSPELCAHTDSRAEEEIEFSKAHLQENIKLVTGFREVNSLIRKLRLKGKEDFARSRINFVPDVAPKLIGQYISGYGHDDRCCVYSAVNAMMQSDPVYPTFVFGFDKEEVGSDGSGGANSKFFEHIVHKKMLDLKAVKRLEDLTEAFKLEVFKNSLAIAGDVDVGANNIETELDFHNVSKLGHGTFIYTSDGTFTPDQISPFVVDYVYSAIGKKALMQIVGPPLSADKSYCIPTMNEFMVRRGIPTINIGIAAASLHSPEELIHRGDLFSTYKAYKAIIESDKQRKFA